eukprot:scaffold13103_cov77-Cyclotella_meneghiniana.AAC.1
MSRRIRIPHDPAIHTRRDQYGRGVAPRTLRGDQAEVVVPLHVLFLEFVEFLDAVDAQFLHFFSEVFGGEFGDVARFGAAVLVGGDEVVGFGGAEDFVEAEGEVGHGKSITRRSRLSSHGPWTRILKNPRVRNECGERKWATRRLSVDDTRIPVFGAPIFSGWPHIPPPAPLKGKNDGYLWWAV